MQLPTAKTPIAKCVQLAVYAQRMLSKFPQNATLAQLAIKLAAAGQALGDAQTLYTTAVLAIVIARVDVRFADHAADRGVRNAQRAAEVADGQKSGPIASKVYPDGVTPIVKPVGATQVREMRDLEGRYDAVAAQWPEAPPEKAKIVALRTDYETALESRRASGQKASDLRAARDVAKEDFLDVYAEVASRVKAEFPRDRKMQDLFFDDVTTAGDAAVEPDEPDAPAEGAQAPA